MYFEDSIAFFSKSLFQSAERNFLGVQAHNIYQYQQESLVEIPANLRNERSRCLITERCKSEEINHQLFTFLVLCAFVFYSIKLVIFVKAGEIGDSLGFHRNNVFLGWEIVKFSDAQLHWHLSPQPGNFMRVSENHPRLQTSNLCVIIIKFTNSFSVARTIEDTCPSHQNFAPFLFPTYVLPEPTSISGFLSNLLRYRWFSRCILDDPYSTM